ncbi:MAG: L,D-transpeptidase family protein [Thomasclavelia sp.]
MDNTVSKKTKPAKKGIHFKNKKIRNSLFIIGGLLAAMIIVYLVGSFYFNQRFLKNTYINGIDVGGLTVEEANGELAKLVNGYTLELKFNDGNVESISGNECGVAYNEDNDVNAVLEKQSSFSWLFAMFSKSENSVDNLAKVDGNVLTSKVASLQHLQAESQVAPQDAYVSYANNQFSIVDEVYGSTIDQAKLITEITAAFSEGKSKLDLTEKKCYVEPGVKASDASIQQYLEAAKTYASAAITYNTKSGDVVLDGSTLITWLSIDANGNYYRDDAVFKEKATEFVSSLAKKINSVGGTRTFVGANNRTITVSGGNYGLRLQNSKEVSGLLEDIYANKVTTRTPVTTGKDAGSDNGGLGDTFVEIDLTSQHMWYHKNGTIVLESDIVSGTYNKPDRRTPGGTYYLYNKERNRTLRGTKKPDGTYEYETPVSYWMPFNKGIGLHDSSSWRSKWGGDIYLNNGSHGCINLPTNIAGQLYNNIEINCPVVCYY